MFGLFPYAAIAAAIQTVQPDQYRQSLDAAFCDPNDDLRPLDALDPNVIDLPPDAVREIRDAPLLTHANGRIPESGGTNLPFDDETDAQQGFDVAGDGRLHGIGDSDGGECD